MTIRVKFFGSVRESVPAAASTIDADEVATAADVWRIATETGLPDEIYCAVNHAHCDLAEAVSDGDEVAFFPPVTGG